MRASLLGTLHDLVEYNGTGSYATFDRAFQKTCRYFSLDPPQDERRRLRQWAFRELRVSGALDYVGSHWRRAPPTLAEVSQDEFVLVAPPSEVQILRGLATSGTWSLRKPPNNLELAPEVFFFPEVAHLIAPRAEAFRLARLTGLRISRDHQDALFAHLPLDHDVTRDLTIEVNDSPIFDPEATDLFDFEKASWVAFHRTTAAHEGLYRRRFDHHPPEYVIAAQDDAKKLKHLRVTDSEWTTAICLTILRQPLKFSHDQQGARLSLHRTPRGLPRLPTLLERALRSGTCHAPAPNDTSDIYNGVTERSVLRLQSRFAMFKKEAKG